MQHISHAKNNEKRNAIGWSIYLLALRLWIGHSMIAGGQSVFTVFTGNRAFFLQWFGHDLGIPAPLLMAFLDKGIEFFGGILIVVGLFTRVSASLVAFVMLVATLVANIDYNSTVHLFRQDASITISVMLFSILLILKGAGSCSIDNFLFRRNYRLI